MPADLRAHVRYPGQLFRVQTTLYARYHMVDPDAFYHREDQWQYPGIEQAAQNASPFMRHIILRLPGESNPEFIYMTPFTPQGKDNLAAWMAARMDGENYGKLVVYQFPKQSLVYGPKQIVNRINQETSISQQLTLWDQKGSQVIRGELLVIPIRGSLIYVQPLYLRAEGGSIPELKRVVVAHENRVAMAETLEEGLGLLFGGDATVAREPRGRRFDGGRRRRRPAHRRFPPTCYGRPRSTTTARSPPNAPAIGPPTAARSISWVRFSSSCTREAASRSVSDEVMGMISR